VSLWRHLTHGLRALTQRTAADRDIADEVDYYFQEAAAALEASGLSPEAARQAAQRELGHAARVREEVRSYGWENLVETVVADVRYGARRLIADRSFALVSIATLALGIGASTAIFSAVNPILFQPLPYPHAERVLTIWDSGRDGSQLEVTFGSYREIAERSRSFEELAVMRPWQPTLTGAADAERLEGQRVSARYFQVLGIAPVIGRTFEAVDDRVRGPRVVLMANDLWHRRFAADPSIIGGTITLDDEIFTVIGVMPAGFENVPSSSAEIWAPLQYDTSLPLQGREWGHHLRLIGRARDGIDIAAVSQDLNAIAGTQIPQYGRPAWASLGNGLSVHSLQADVTASVKPAMLSVLGAATLLLALACVNVTNLLLGRGARRRAEFAMRAALGAGRSRLIRQLVTESLLLAALGGAAGIAIAAFGVRALVSLSPPGLPRVNAVAVDAQTLLFTLLVTAIVGIAAGLVPALHATHGDIQRGLERNARVAAGGQQTARNALVMMEVALAVVLLVGAGLLLRSLQHWFAIAPGFEPAHVLTMQVQASGRRFDAAAAHRFFARALEAVHNVPGVSAAAFTSQLPLSGQNEQYGVSLQPELDGPAEPGNPAYRYAVSPTYLDTLSLPLLHGRTLSNHDTADAPRVTLVSESLAKKLPRSSPLGRRLRLGADEGPPFEVVGVVGDVKQLSLAATDADAFYVPAEQWRFPDTARWLVVRTRGDAAALAPAVRAAIASVDKDQPVVRVSLLEALVAATAAERRFALILFEIFGAVALVLAAIGLYGLLAGTVAERSREIGIRSALGASRGAIVGMVVRQAMALTLAGVAAGVIAAVAAGRGLSTLLFGVTHLDMVTYVAVIGLLIVTAFAACLVPARRAAWLDPTTALKLE
jgi:putative ABC transport system permease protein